MPKFSDCWRCGNTVGVGIICQLCELAKYYSEKCQKNDIFRHEAECIPASVLKTCSTCRKSGKNLKACTGCYRAFYCDVNCQKSGWNRHKIHCLEVKEVIEATAGRVSVRYLFLAEKTAKSCRPFYWGNAAAFDCLNLAENEGPTYSTDLNVLIFGVGDLRNVALTCASLPDSFESKLVFTLNDRESCVLARLVLLLYMLSKGGIGVEATVTEIWYSILLSKKTYKLLRTSLEELFSFTSGGNLKSKTAGLISIAESHFKQIQDVWKTWLSLRVEGTEWIQKQRKKTIKSGDDFELAIMSGYILNIPVEHTVSARKWIDDGVMIRTKAPTFAENPTLTGVDHFDFNPFASFATYSYCIESRNFPFAGWDYLQVKKFKSCDCLVTMYSEYVECILRNFVKKLSNGQITFKIVLSDCMHIKRHIHGVYDRILTSNLMDYIFSTFLTEDLF